MKLKKIILAMVAVILVVFLGIFIWYTSGKKAVKNESKKEIISVEINEGMRSFCNSQFT